MGGDEGSQPPAVDDTETTLRADLSEWASYHWKRLQRREASMWSPPGSLALAITGIAALVLVVGGVFIPMVCGLAVFVLGQAQWVIDTAAGNVRPTIGTRYL